MPAVIPGDEVICLGILIAASNASPVKYWLYMAIACVSQIRSVKKIRCPIQAGLFSSKKGL